MSVNMLSTPRLQFTPRSGELTPVHEAPARDKGGVVGSVVRLAVALFALLALAGLAVFALLPVVLLGAVVLLPALLPVMFFVGCVLGASTQEAAAVAPARSVGESR